MSQSLSSLKVIIIGGTGGLGHALAQNLASKKALVTVVGRNFKDEDNSNIKFIKADLSLMKNVSNLIDEKIIDISKYDLIIFTAGIIASRAREETSEGLERDLATSYLNRYLFLSKSISDLKPSNNAILNKPRIFIMAYPGTGQLGEIDDLNQEKKYSYWTAHMNTVAGNEALVTHFSGSKNYQIYGLNPGLVKTNIRNNLLGNKSWLSSTVEFFIGWIFKSPEDYAKIMLPLLIDPSLDNKDGTFYDNKAKMISPSKDLTKEYAYRYISESKELLNKKGLLL